MPTLRLLVRLKRPAETDIESERVITDVEDLVNAPAVVQSEPVPMEAAVMDVCSVELVEKGEISGLKAELNDGLVKFVHDYFKAHEVDADKSEVQSIARTS